MSSADIVQLLADTAKRGIPFADAAVVHLLGGNKNQTLIAMGSFTFRYYGIRQIPDGHWTRYSRVGYRAQKGLKRP